MTNSPDFLWLVLQRLPGATAAAVRRLLTAADRAGWPQGADAIADWLARPAAALDAARVPPLLIAGIIEWQRAGRRHAAARQAEVDSRWLQQHDARLLVLPGADYPALLREIADPPIWLYIRGDLTAMAAPQLAVVGSRRATRQGADTAALFAGALAAAGCVITSGLAYGIDASAHRAALEAGGRTVAVLGTGLDRVYPARHAELASGIVKAGALVSELPLGSPPRAGHFPRRNRIISGLSLGVLVIEAALRSGSLVTARLALEQNREVFAVPGSIHNPASRGCNALIRQGAVLVQAIEDILQELRGWQPAVAVAAAPNRTGDQLGAATCAVLAAVGFEPTALEGVMASTRGELPTVMAALAELELAGLIEAVGADWQRRA